MQGLENSNQWLFCPENSALSTRAREINGLNIVLFKKRGGTDLRAGYKLAQSIRKHQPDILHAHDAQAHTLCVLAHLMGISTPIVLHRRVDFQIRGNFFTRFKYNHPGIKKIICVSDAIRHIVLQSIPQPEKVVTIHSCAKPISTPKEIARKKILELCGLNDQGLLIGNISALADHKDLMTFIHTAAQLHAKEPNLRFIILGEGEERAKLENAVKNYRLEHVFCMPGYMADARNLMPALDIFLFTSKTEGLGTTVLDAMLAGVPVVATRAGGVPEMVIHRKTGLLCEVGDARALANSVQEMINDSELRKNLIDRAFEMATDFSQDAMTKKTLAVYKEVLTESP